MYLMQSVGQSTTPPTQNLHNRRTSLTQNPSFFFIYTYKYNHHPRIIQSNSHLT
ncbi:hypothetical protein NC651_035667 [Populus alba x Populus x berolinensis]|nr:hypothetical protein NC651_035667 [Populus alba x Populus x berolinensis]